MKWFAAFWVTFLLTIVALGLHDLVQLAMPDPAVTGLGSLRMIALIAGATYFFSWLIIYRMIAYTESAIEASPRGEHAGSRPSESALALVHRLFYNPARWWMTPYALLLALAAAVSIVVRGFNWIIPGNPFGDWGPWRNLLFILMLLYCLTVLLAWLNPDRARPLRVAIEPHVDPVLAISGDAEPVIAETQSQVDQAIGAALPPSIPPPVAPVVKTTAPKPEATPKRTPVPKAPKAQPEVKYREHFWQFWRIKPPTIALSPPDEATGSTGPTGAASIAVATGPTVAGDAPVITGPTGPGSPLGETGLAGPTAGADPNEPNSTDSDS